MASYLKWAGGKAGLAEQIIPLFPTTIKKYIEPFCGSAAMYLCYANKLFCGEESCFPVDVAIPCKFILSDINENLLNCHLQMQNNFSLFMDELADFENRHNKDAKKTYLAERKEVANLDIYNPPRSAARFYYINKTCFNGLWRVNKSGGFNVPWNQIDKVDFDKRTLKHAHALLRQADIYRRDFVASIKEFAKEGDFVYLDPPYYPLNATSNFTSYNENPVDDDNLLESLFDICMWMDNRNINWLMSNSSAEQVKERFQKYKISEIAAPRFVKALKKGEKRETVQETLIRNY